VCVSGSVSVCLYVSVCVCVCVCDCMYNMNGIRISVRVVYQNISVQDKSLVVK